MSDLELLAKTMEDFSTTSGDHHMQAAAAIRTLIKKQKILDETRELLINQNLVLYSQKNLLDEFAMAALTGICAAQNAPTGDWETCAAHAFSAARAMMAEREKTNES